MSGSRIRQAEAEEMRARVSAGGSRKVIAYEMGRSVASVWLHTRGVRSAIPNVGQLQARSGLKQRAERLDRLFTACARAVEARP